MKMDTLKKAIPTFMGYWERRRQEKKNQLPKHLRPLLRRPVFVQMVLNTGIIITLSWLMLNRDEFLTEAAPAVGLVVCLLLLIYTLISALQLKHRFLKAPGYRLTLINLWIMGIAWLLFPISVTVFLP